MSVPRQQVRAPDGVSRYNGFRAGPSPADDRGLNYGPAPAGIARFFRPGNQGFAGPMQQGTVQNSHGLYGIVMRRNRQSYPTRGVRSISGGFTRGGRYADTARIPAVFVPVAPLRSGR